MTNSCSWPVLNLDQAPLAGLVARGGELGDNTLQTGAQDCFQDCVSVAFKEGDRAEVRRGGAQQVIQQPLSLREGQRQQRSVAASEVLEYGGARERNRFQIGPIR